MPSRDGTSAIFFAISPPVPDRVQISTSCGKPFIGIRWENGRLIFATRTNCPLGEGVTLLRIAGRPRGALAPVAVLITASWLVK